MFVVFFIAPTGKAMKELQSIPKNLLENLGGKPEKELAILFNISSNSFRFFEVLQILRNKISYR